MIYSLHLKADVSLGQNLQLQGGFYGSSNKVYCNCSALRCLKCRKINKDVNVIMSIGFQTIGCVNCNNRFTVTSLPAHRKPYNFTLENCGYSEIMRFDFDGGIPSGSVTFGQGWEIEYHGRIYMNLDLGHLPISFPTAKTSHTHDLNVEPIEVKEDIEVKEGTITILNAEGVFKEI